MSHITSQINQYFSLYSKVVKLHSSSKIANPTGSVSIKPTCSPDYLNAWIFGDMKWICYTAFSRMLSGV